MCYSFWCGGALAVSCWWPSHLLAVVSTNEDSTHADALRQTLSHAALVNAPANTSFLLNAQSPIGGFGKAPEDFPDPFHSYLALAALALTPARDELGLKEIDAVWNLPPAARDWLLRGGRE